MNDAAAQLASPTPFEVIEQASFFSVLSTEQRARVARCAKTYDFPPRADIYKLGDRAECCYVLVRGIVRFNLALGTRTTSAGDILKSGDLFGWAALIRTAQRRIATASCVTTCGVVAIRGDALLQLMDDDHEIGYAIMSRVSLLITSTITSLVTG